jgi:predicted MPP superfamily phosphohydrolase
MRNNLNILHLSDLHFGCENTTLAARRRNVLNRLIDVLKREDNKWKPHLLVVSGDIGWRGAIEDYKYASEWLKELLDTLGLTANEFISCPGNHDIDLNEAQFLVGPANSKEADEFLQIENIDRFSQPFKNYISFCKEIGMRPLSIGKESSHLIGVRKIEWIRFVVLNSAWFCRKSKMEKLWIGLPHLQLMEASGQLVNDQIFTVSILHHPPECFHDEETNSYGNRLNTYRCLARKNNLILSGHVHGVLKEHDQKYGQAYLFTGGSSYSSDSDRNNCSIFQVDREKGTILRRPFEFDPADGSWEYREKYRVLIYFKDKKLESFEDIVINRFPYPIASLFRITTAIDESEEPEKKLDSILSTAESIARFLGIIAILEIIRASEKGSSLPKGFLKNKFREVLKTPSFVTWVILSREGFDFLEENNINTVIPGLNFFYFKDRGKPTESKEVFDELVKMKEYLEKAKNRSRLTFQKYVQLSRIANKFLTTIIKNLADLANFSCGLIQTIELKKNKREAPVFFYKGKNLGGKDFVKEAIKKLNEEPFRHFKETDAVILKFEDHENYLNFFPFYIYEEDVGDAPDIFYYNGIKGKRILYRGCDRGGTFEIDNNLPKIEEEDWETILSGNLKRRKPGGNVKPSPLIENELDYVFKCFSGDKDKCEG